MTDVELNGGHPAVEAVVQTCFDHGEIDGVSDNDAVGGELGQVNGCVETLRHAVLHQLQREDEINP